jgi:long-chain acyl-CoA synthetase
VIFERAERDPDALALDDLTRRRSWGELAERVQRVARLLREDLGLAPDDHAAVLMDNRAEFVEIVLGAMLAGIWLTPINRHLAASELAYVMRDSGARVVFTDAAHAGPAQEAGAVRTLEAGEQLEAALASASPEPMPLDGPAGGNMIYTSGTSGRPKGVKRLRAASLGAALEAARASGEALGLDGSGPHLVTGPLYHAAPLLFAVYDQLNGAPMLILPRWDEERALALLRERRIHHTHLVPSMFVRLLRLPDALRRGFRAPDLHLVLHGAAPVSAAVKRRMIDWWGEVFVEYWGGTEGGVCTLADSREWLEHPGTVGRALAHYEVFAVDDAGRRLPPGREGLLYSRHLRFDDVFAYHGAPEKTAEAYLGPGAFTLGDVGRVDADGWVYLADRRSNTIISGGVNIYPAEIEQVLQEHPAVADVGVFGIPDDEWGETVKAAVELRPGIEPSEGLEAEILAFGRERLAGYKVPRSIDFEAKLPRHPTGKLVVRQLRERYWRGRERRI